MSEKKAEEREEKAPKVGAEVDPSSIGFLNDVTLEVIVELGRTDLTIERLLRLKKGSVVTIDKLSGEPLDVRVNGKLAARGEAVIVNEKFGVRVTQVVTPMGEGLI